MVHFHVCTTNQIRPFLSRRRWNPSLYLFSIFLIAVSVVLAYNPPPPNALISY